MANKESHKTLWQVLCIIHECDTINLLCHKGVIWYLWLLGKEKLAFYIYIYIYIYTQNNSSALFHH